MLAGALVGIGQSMMEPLMNAGEENEEQGDDEGAEDKNWDEGSLDDLRSSTKRGSARGSFNRQAFRRRRPTPPPAQVSESWESGFPGFARDEGPQTKEETNSLLR